jgi:dienelactone hydrolase
VIARRGAVAALLAALVGACSGGGTEPAAPTTSTTSPTSTTTPDARPYDVTRTTETFVDASRPTIGAGGVEHAPARTLVTDVYVPEGDGPFPLVVHAHGLDGNRTKFTGLLGAWAAAGYVVAAPTFPLTSNESVQRVIVDHVNQPADVAFVISAVSELLGERVDTEHVGVSGLSLGSSAAYGVGFHPCCRDDRVDAVVIMDGLRFPLPGGEYDLDGIPLLLSHTTGDARLSYEEALDAFESTASERYLLTLDGAGHAEPYEDAPSPFDDVVEAVTIDFWDLVLRGDIAARDRMVRHADVEGLASLRS